MSLITPVILCGGAGTRLWPLSRDSFPKQFMPLLGDKSTFEDTLSRISDKSLFTDPIIMTAEPFRFIISDILARYKMSARIVLEPMRRDSGAAIAAAAQLIKMQNPSQPMLVLAADHGVKEHRLFVETVRAALPAAKTGSIVTFGIIPSEPSTGFGYIQAKNEPLGPVKKVARFVEKPNSETAQKYIQQGYYWNSGNFLFRADIFLNELEQFEPAMAAAALGASKVTKDTTVSGVTFERLNKEAFAASPTKSVDYAVMEKTDKAAVIPASYTWSDLGSYSAIYDLMPKDGDGNVTRGNVKIFDVKNSYIDSRKPFTAVIGLEDIAVIAMEDAVLVAPRSATNEIKTLVNEMKANKNMLAEEHSKVYRPWGWYDSIEKGENFQVKRIGVNPGARLSLQTHKFRQENWVVVKGLATVEINGSKQDLKINQSCFIPLGAVHRLSNNTNEPVEIIEVQHGTYLGEDDIVRLEDDYKRPAVETSKVMPVVTAPAVAPISEKV